MLLIVRKDFKRRRLWSSNCRVHGTVALLSAILIIIEGILNEKQTSKLDFYKRPFKTRTLIGWVCRLALNAGPRASEKKSVAYQY